MVKFVVYSAKQPIITKSNQFGSLTLKEDFIMLSLVDRTVSIMFSTLNLCAEYYTFYHDEAEVHIVPIKKR